MVKDKIFLQDMIFYGYHGALAAEKEIGQRFIVDLEIDINLQPAGLSDDLSLTVNYANLYSIVQEIVTGKSYDLIESVAEKIAKQVLEQEPLVEKVKVVLKKPEVPIPGILSYAAIQIVRER